MLDKLTGRQVHAYIHFVGLLALAVGLPLSKIPLSLGTILLGLNVLMYWNWKEVWKRWVSNQSLIYLFVFSVLLLASIGWSTDKQEALNYIRNCLPFLVLPFAIYAIPLVKSSHYIWIFASFVIAVFVISFINVGTYFHWWGNKQYDDIRSLSLFVSHIRYSLMLVLSIILCLGWWKRKLPYRNVAIIFICWFIFYINLSQSGTGYIIISILGFIYYLYFITTIQRVFVKRMVVLVSFLIFSTGVVYVIYQLTPTKPKVTLSNQMLGSRSPNGNAYVFNPFENVSWENGYPVYAFIVDEELREAWNQVSKIPYDSTDLKGNPIKPILIRYMTSKGLKKDATDFSRLTSFDIHNIESGMTSIEMKDGGIKSFLYQLKYQLKNTDNPNGKSFLERVEYLKSGFHILATNWLIGVGAGDLQQTFNQSYDELNSKLIQENRHLTHNQFITFWIAAGFLCLLIFVGIWVVQLKNAFKSRSIEWLGFLGVLLISFLFEDTLQTQTGASFAALFIALFPLLFSTQNKE